MFPKYENIMDYEEWFKYWLIVTHEAHKVGDSKTANKFYDILNNKFGERMEKETTEKKKKFYKYIIDSAEYEYIKFYAYTGMIRFNIQPDGVLEILKNIMESVVGINKMNMRMYIQEYEKGNI